MFNLSNRSLKVQLGLMLALLISLAFAATATIVYYQSSAALTQKALNNHQAEIKALSHTLESSFDSYLAQAKTLQSALSKEYLAGVDFDGSSVMVNGVSMPQLAAGGTLLSSNAIIDKFGRDTGIPATVFVRDGRQFMRISTSLTNTNGQRILGTPLDPRSATYQSINRGQDFYNKVSLFGRDYITYYSPLMNAKGTVVGAAAVAMDVSEVSKTLFATMAEIPWGDTGYSIVFDNSAANRGTYLHHPLQENLGQNIISKATAEKPFQKLFEADTGVIRYPHVYNGVSGEKYLAFAKVEGWNWVVTGGTFIKEVTKETETMLEVLIGVAILASAITVMLVMMLLGRMLRPLQDANEYMTALGLGRVSVDIPRVDDDSRNEVTAMTYSMRQMAKQLHLLVGEIKGTSERSSEGASQVATQANNSLTQSDSQQHQIDQMAAAIEEMAQSANAVAEQVETVAVTVRTANNDSEKGSVLVQEMEQQIGSFDAQLNASTDAIHKVNDESKNIQAVTSMIDSIAEQTNLLALNAAIEAARAGEQGRGFAVVADEVRQLAHRTQNSVQEVVGIITQLEQRIGSAVELMNESQQTSVVVKEKAAAAGESLRSITVQINGIASMAENIAATSEQQAQVSQEIASSAGNVSDLNRLTRTSSAQTADSATELQRLAENLNKQVDYFS
ncbi:Cache 3/Cache 2 fusion domain-containing protein [uncultured Ferrimonas sp.]|uniref:methyl-accepting chemotaxis protein n=1 Tax=uncultured Ferrimonas sp. TaxID=432640 RepID=UPI00260C6462|nr:Cache 3/Cache 2 fusion domain-containing protein [uncultured Ferrimonas sp.]